MVDSQRIELLCSACGTRFRIRLKPNVALHALPCPKCQSTVSLDEEESGTESKSAGELFGRSRSATSALTEPVAPPNTSESSRFRDVSNVALDRDRFSKNVDLTEQPDVKTNDEPPSRPPVPEDKPRPKFAIDKERLRKKLKAEIGKLPEPSDPIALKPVEPPEPVEPPIVDPIQPPVIAPPANVDAQLQPTIPFDDSDLDRGLEVRVEGTEYGVIAADRLEQIVASGVWPGAIEVRVDEEWIRFDHHPALPLIRSRLKEKAKAAVTQISQEWERDEIVIPTSSEAQAPPDESAPVTISSAAPTNRGPVVAMIVILIVGAISAYFFTRPNDPEPTVKETPKPIEAPPEARENALAVLANTQELANRSARYRDREPSDLMEDAAASIARSNFGDALDALFELRRRNPKEKSVLTMLIKAQLGAARFRDARQTTVQLAALDPKSKETQAFFRDAIQRDRSLDWNVLEVGQGVEVDTIKALGGGKSVSFKFKRDDRNVYAFKPSQHEWEEGWRGEIAAYRFCELANCGFRVPRSRPAKVSRTTLEKLYPMNTEWQTGYAERFEEIAWKTEVVNGKSVEFAYGVLKDWEPHFADWPIEYTDLWLEWLNPTIDATGEYDRPLRDAMAVVEERNRDAWRALVREFDDTSVRQTAAQISNLLVFDFMINNWDRFSDKEEYYGVNNQFADGQFVSIDNGAGFGLRHSSRVQSRFDLVGRFSREMIASVRLIEPRYQGFLMPNPSDSEQQRMKLFWERRTQVLTRVKKQMEQYDEDDILAFD